MAHRVSFGGRGLLSAWVAATVLVPRAEATFHFMQIEQVIGGVHNDPTAQAIQLRMITNGQNFVSRGKLWAWDANGENPVLLIDFPVDVASGTGGDRVLAVSERFVQYASPVIAPDFILEELIPESYLAAGSITFENNDGTLIVFRLSWGGASYTGDTTGALTNDNDGDFGPPFDGPLPSDGLSALMFQREFSADSIANATDFALSDGAAVFVNNAGLAFTVTEGACAGDEDFDGDGVRDGCDECPDDPDRVTDCDDVDNVDDDDGATDDGDGDMEDAGDGDDHDHEDGGDMGDAGDDVDDGDDAPDDGADDEGTGTGNGDDGDTIGSPETMCGQGMQPALVVMLSSLGGARWCRCRSGFRIV